MDDLSDFVVALALASAVFLLCHYVFGWNP